MKLFRGKSFKYGFNLFIIIMLVATIIAVANIIIASFNIKIDLTFDKNFTLSQTTNNVVNKINKDVTIYWLIDEPQLYQLNQNTDMPLPMDYIKELVLQYDKFSKVNVYLKNLDDDPGFIKKIDPKGVLNPPPAFGDFVFISGDKIKKMAFADTIDTSDENSTGTLIERKITTKIKEITSENIPVLYYSSGHGEIDFRLDYNYLNYIFDQFGYEVKELPSNQIPSDTDLILFAGPSSDISQDEASRYKDYFKKGGRGVFLFKTDSLNRKLNNFNSVLKEFNVSVNNDFVKENDSAFKSGSFMMEKITANQITPELLDSKVYLTSSRSLNILNVKDENIVNETLVKTSAKAEGQVEGKTITGNIPLFVASEKTNGTVQTKALISGNFDFLSDNFYNQGTMGYDLFFQSMTWVSDIKNAEQLDIASRTYYRIGMDMSDQTKQIVTIIIAAVIPALIIILGLVIWLRRRHL